MSGKYQAYPEYKDSGVEWLGDIPTDWELWKLTHAYEEIGSGTTPPSGSDEWYGGDVPWVTTGELRETEIVSTTKSVTEETLRRFPTLRKYPKGSIAIAMYGATIGRLGIFGIEATTNQACCVLTKSAVIDNKYLYYWLQAFKPDIVNLASGGGQPNINQEVVASLKISSPEVSGQKKIANFLDYETAKIDTLIEKQQQLIALLKEKRQAVISHAVTKGLNANAPMRDSGVEWLGEVPEHWDVTPLKFLCDLLKDGTHLPPPRINSGVPLLSVRNIVNSKFIFRNDDSQVSEADYEKLCKPFVPQTGDVLLAIVGATLGKVAIVEEMGRFHIQRSVAIFRTNQALMTSEFLFNIFGSSNFQSLLWENVGFSAQPGIYLGTLENFRLPVAPCSEQTEINNYCREKSSSMDILIGKSEDAIQLMRERRIALISAAVTGKIDVRSWEST